MFIEQIRRAIPATPRTKLHELAAAVWKAFAAGAITEREAQGLAEEIHGHKTAAPPPRRSVGSRPRTPESMGRRRRWAMAGMMPPQLAAQFTMGEIATLAVLAAEITRKGSCKLTIGHIAALAGVGRTTARNAIRQAAVLGLLRSEEWRLSAWRSAPNTVTIVSGEWASWLRLHRAKQVGSNLRDPRIPIQFRNQQGVRTAARSRSKGRGGEKKADPLERGSAFASTYKEQPS